jgi:hypothetical protein
MRRYLKLPEGFGSTPISARAISERMKSAKYEQYLRVQKRLKYAPVPKALCDVIRSTIPEVHQGFAFRIASHLLGNITGSGDALGVRWHPISNSTFNALADSFSSCVMPLVREFEKTGLLDRRHCAVKGKASKIADKYRLTDPAINLVLSSGDAQRYNTFKAYLNRKPERVVRARGLEPSVLTLCEVDKAFVASIEALQRRSVQFDWTASAADLHKRKGSMSDADFARLFSWLLRLHGGDNYTQFTVIPNGRLYTCGALPLQNLPKDLRRFVVPHDGYVLRYFDYNAQEPRIVAALSGDGPFTRT